MAGSNTVEARFTRCSQSDYFTLQGMLMGHTLFCQQTFTWFMNEHKKLLLKSRQLEKIKTYRKRNSSMLIFKNKTQTMYTNTKNYTIKCNT